MASPCSSSSSSRQNHPDWKPRGTSNSKASQSINDYINSYLTENLLKPQLPHLNKLSVVYSQANSDGEVPSRDRSENNHRTKIRNKTEAKRLNELTKEMDKMLSRVKSKRQTNDFLQLFKNTLNNFIIPEHPLDDNNSNTQLKSESTKDYQTISPLSSNYRHDHYHMQTSQETNEIHPQEQNLFSNRETSVTVTSTLTRCKIKEPKNNALESSKTNVLHRCYGKQSVKALPLTHRSRKRTNNSCTNTNCQRPQLVKSKSQKLPKQQSRMINQQMKTIYENEQFDKSEKLVSENLEDVNELVVCDSTSHSSIETNKVSVIETRVSNEISNDKSEKLKQNTCKLKDPDERSYDSKLINKVNESGETSDTIKHHETIIMKLNSEQDNSIVQRLTSFWNKKLNSVEENKSISDPSIVTSSLTSIFEEQHKDEAINTAGAYNHETVNNQTNELDYHGLNDSSMNSESKLVRDEVKNVYNNDDNNKKLVKNVFIASKTENEKCKQLSQNEEIPQLKFGLMDELLTVLRSRDNTVKKHKKKNTKDKMKQNINYDQNSMHSELNSLTSVHFDAVEIDDTGDEKSECSDEYIDSKFDDNSDVDHDNDDDFVSIDDEKTFEAIERCLLENMSNEEINEDESYVKNQFDIGLEEPALNIVKIPTFSNDDLDMNEIKDNEKTKSTKQTENSYDETNFDINDHSAVITNVNCIIKNLKELIRTIESIPEELKSVDMNLNCLPIPDKIKRKISSLIVTPNTESRQSRLSLIKPLDGMDPQLKLLIPPAEKNQLFRCSSSGKLLGYSKKEGYNCTLYFPKILTKPILQSVKNPIQKVLFPRRSDYLNNKARRFNITMLDKSDKNVNSVKNYDKDDIENDKGNNDEHKYDESVGNDENCDGFEESLNQNNDIIGKEEQVIEECITAATKIKTRSTQSSIFYVTPPPNSIITQLLPSNMRKDDCFAKLKSTLLNESVEATAIVSNKTIQNTKSNMKFGEHFFMGNTNVNNSVEELSDGMSIISYTLSNRIQPAEFNVITVNNIDNNVKNNDDCSPDESNALHGEIIINLDENRHSLPNDVFFSNRRSIRKRHNLLHNNLDNDNTILNGGCGDSMQNCGDSIASTAIPCHQTSSMSVIVSNSINDSNSQPDITIADSEYNLNRSRINSHCNTITRSLSPQDFDNFSICNVIQEEQSDEQLSEIDDFFMIKQHTSKMEINKNICGTVSTASTLSQNTDLSNNLMQQEQDIPVEMGTSHTNINNHSNNELSCNTQFTFQNLMNKITEETSLIKQNLPNNVEQNVAFFEDESINGNGSDEISVNENCCKDSEDYCIESIIITEGNTEESEKIISLQQDIEVPVTSFLSENINTNNINVMNLSLNINNNSDIATDINENIYCDKTFLNLNSINIEDESNELDRKNTENIKNIIINKNDFFHQSYHALYFETDISKDGQKAMTNKIIISNCKNNLDAMLKNDPSLKDELVKIIDIDNLCDKEKQMMAACIYLINQKFCDRSSTFLNTSKHNLSLASGMNTLWDKTSQTMFITIGLAKKSLMPYDFETETLLYRRRYKKLCKAFYTLFVSLLLVFMIQKHIFGILLPVCFPW